MGLSLFKKKQTEEEIYKQNRISSENGEIKLIILTESHNLYLKQFFIARGIHPYEVCYSVESASLALMRERTSVRLVIIEQGNGDMYNISTRDDLQALLSMCDGVYKKALVFYTKSNFRYDNRGYSAEVVRWESYDGLAKVADTLDELQEEYVCSSEGTNEVEDSTPVMCIRGKRVECINSVITEDAPSITREVLKALYSECERGDGESIEQFD